MTIIQTSDHAEFTQAVAAATAAGHRVEILTGPESNGGYRAEVDDGATAEDPFDDFES